MPRCRVKRGFFVLHDCGSEAVGGCSECARPRCAEHTAGTLCTDCHARRAEAQLEPFESGWTHQRRDAFYREEQYAPLYVGQQLGSYYDTYDVRPFDADVSADDDPDGSFFDS